MAGHLGQENVSLSLDFENGTAEGNVFLEDSVNEDIFRLMQIICTICYSLSFILGIVDNGLVIWIAGFKMSKRVNSIWFLNLAIADFVFDIFFPFLITETAMEGRWPFGQIMCKVIFTVLHLNMYVSTFFLVIISVDRCISVWCPVWSTNHRSSRLATIISAITWMLCLVLSSPYFAFYTTEHDESENVMYCVPIYAYDYHTDKWRYKILLITRFVVMFLVPFSIILLCYALIILKVRRRRQIKGSSRTFNVIITIVNCFFFCWFPFYFLPLLEFMNVKMSATGEFVMLNIACCLAFFETCLNPVIYAFIGHDFKKSFMKSIPFSLENFFKERCTNNDEHQSDNIMNLNSKLTTVESF
ncbi:formyl peptide receptor 2 [Xenopus laevis]|uniref:Formyl peptide receptor 2 n=2 Tax=Xenopus laevis TaxID=8355 RepID=A0A1L8FNY2_XENLA|nr:formyl peptide receptor 2 [Xenopus laevis]OCT73304.1 hypothetical protein XELAEV_18036285mg [Xenopus laevis]